MLQRIQSVYLALSAVFIAIFYIIPISYISVGETSYVVKPSGLYLIDEEGQFFESPLFALGAVLLFSFIMTAVAIFQFKNRKMQIKLCSLILALITIAIALVFFRADDIPENLVGNAIPKIEYSFGALFLILPGVFTFLAQRSIKKDEALVKSLDRLR